MTTDVDQVLCIECGQVFDRPRKRGRPWLRCERCRGWPVEPDSDDEPKCGYCRQEFDPSSSTDSEPDVYCSDRCGGLGRVAAEAKGVQAELGESEWWRRLMAMNTHNRDQDNALILFWSEERMATLPTWEEYNAAVDEMRAEMGIPRVHGYPDPAELPPIIYPDDPEDWPK